MTQPNGVPEKGFFRFKRMSFGGMNFPATLRHLADKLFAADWPVMCYLDDIIVITKTFKEHVHWLRKVMQTLLDAGLVINMEKCSFCVSRVVYSGFLLDAVRPRLYQAVYDPV